MNVVLLGAPGAGKGTYAQRLVGMYDLIQISTGDLLRIAVKNNTALGIKAKSYMDSGALVPDELVIELLKDDAKKGVIFDGFPRTIEQAKKLGDIAKIDIVINCDVSEEEVIKRISGRKSCKSCGTIYNMFFLKEKVENVCDNCGGELFQREDDKENIVKDRLKTYHQKTAPLIDYYKEKNLLEEVDANQRVNDPNSHVIEDFKEILDKYKRN
jgi:adenylate kinase